MEGLQSIIEEYNFTPYGVRGTKWTLNIDNDSNCQSKIFLHLLRGGEVVRLSIGDQDVEFIDVVDMFETRDANKIKKFIDLIL